MKNHYETLELKIGASDFDIKRAFRRLAVKYHPDKNLGDEYFTSKFIEIKEAYDVLINSESRNIYDSLLEDYLNSELKSELKDQEEKRYHRKQREKEREESFHYEPFKPFYSFRDREQQETPQFAPVYDLWGEKIKYDIEFFILPNRIGKIVGAYSDLTNNDKPFTSAQKSWRVFKWGLVGLSMATIIYFVGNPLPFWMIVWFVGLPIGAIWLADKENKFEHRNYFIGVNGFAKYGCTGSKENINIKSEYNFNEIAEVFVYQVEKRYNFQYNGTDFYYLFFDHDHNLIHEINGAFDKKNDDIKMDVDIHYCRGIEHYWTIYLLDRMEKEIEHNGYIIFNLYKENNRLIPYVKLGIGYITFLKNGDSEFTYKFNDIKKVYSRNNELFIEHKNYQKSFFFIKSGNADKIPLMNLCNRQYFFKTMEILLGYKI